MTLQNIFSDHITNEGKKKSGNELLITFILPSNQHHKNDDDEYFRLPTKGSVYEKFE